MLLSYEWFDKGQLDMYCGARQPPNLLVEGVTVYHQARNQALINDRDLIKKKRDKKRGSGSGPQRPNVRRKPKKKR